MSQTNVTSLCVLMLYVLVTLQHHVSGTSLVKRRAMDEIRSTATRFYTDKLPTNKSTVTVRDSRPGNILPSIANGYIGTVLYSDTIHISGLYNGHANPKKRGQVYPVYFFDQTHRARIPSTTAIDYNIIGVTGKDSFALDVADGVFYHWFKASNNKLSVEQRFYAHRSRRHLLVVELSVHNDLGAAVALQITNNRGKDSRDINLVEVDAGNGIKAATGKINTTEEDGSIRPRVAVVWSDIPSTLTVRGSPGEQTWLFVTAVATSLDTKFEPLTQAMSQWQDAVRDKKSLLSTHKKAWTQLWNSGKIDVEGNLELSQSIYSSLYYLLSSTRADWPYGMSPGGLPGGEEYFGHTFWDQDIWMYPTLVLLQPELARASLRYRYERLPAAKRIARKFGYKGAMFPWESSYTGLETSPGEVYGKNQIHITSDIAHATKLYWRTTLDERWLREIGYELVFQTAEFWASRVELRAQSEDYVINDVMPPDEYQYPVNNSVYTNVGAKLNLEFAIKISKLLRQDVPSKWSEIASKLFIPYDRERDYHPEFEGYTVGTLAKQADTILIGYPLMYPMARQTRYNDLKYYENYTDPDGPAMTHSMFAIGWLELAEVERAAKPFLKNYQNMNGPFKVWTEHRGRRGAANFITGAGGFLQAVLYGYGGFRIRENQLDFNPTLPPTTTKFTITGVNYLGSSLSFATDKDSVTVYLNKKAQIAPELEIVKDGKSYRLSIGKDVSLASGKGAIRMRQTSVPSQACQVSVSNVFSALMGILCALFLSLGKVAYI